MAIRIIGGALRGRNLRVPPGRAVRPTTDRVRESLFNILGERVRDRVVYDLFAGSGALGIEALSRGARRAVFVERHPRGAALIRRNLRELGVLAQATVIVGDAFAWLQRMQECPEAPALVLLDPPYEQLRRAPQQFVALLGELRQRFPPGTIVVVEHDGGFDPAMHAIAGNWETRVYGQTRVSLSVFGDRAEVMSKSPEPEGGGAVSTTAREQFAREVVGRLTAAGFRALWAGGCVRDMLLGRPPEDYDVATEAHPEQVREVFGRRRTVAVGAAFGVVEVLGPRRAGKVQVATFRSDLSYSDGRHPDRVEFGTAEADAQRRDFTINGMFYDPLKEEVLDYIDGQEDLKSGIVRAIGNPSARFAEDKLRLLRAVRFAANLGFTIEPSTFEAVRRLAPEIHVVSAERIAEELRRMLVHPNRETAMQLAFDLGLIEAVLPELLPMKDLPQHKPMQPAGDLWDHTLLVLNKLDASWAAINAQRMGIAPSPALPFPLAFAALLHDVGKPATVGQSKGKLTFHNHEHKGREIAESVCRRLKLSNDETACTCWLVEHHMYLGQSSQLRWSKLKRMLVEPGIVSLLALHWADALASTGDTSSIAYCLDVLRNMPEEQLNPPALLTGHDLIRHGVAKGPIYGKILEAVRDAQLENEVRSKREALALVDELMEQYKTK